MVERSDEQQAVPPGPPPPAYSQYPDALYHGAPQPAPLSEGHPPQAEARQPREQTTGRLMRLLLRRVVYGLVVLGALIKPRLGSVILVSLLIGIIGFQSLALLAPLLINKSVDSRVALLEPATAVLEFLQGQREFDAERIWNSFSPELQAALLDQGATKDDLAVQLENERAAGQRYGEFEYIGGVDIDDDKRMFFYIVNIVSPAPDRNGKFSFIFTVDRSGKIIGVRM